jgi:hypothetical protein
MKSVILLEGIKGWALAGKGYESYMERFEPEVWRK